MTTDITYPKDGGVFGDYGILHAAVHFTTHLRAHQALRLLTQHPDSLREEYLCMLGADAFSAKMSSGEDLLGWFFVLREWTPKEHYLGLLRLMRHVEVGRKTRHGDYREETALSILEGLDIPAFRELLHIPIANEDLLRAGLTERDVDLVKRALPAQLGGFKKLALQRNNNDRGLVQAYNRLKHFSLGWPTRDEKGVLGVHIPKSATFPSGPVITTFVEAEPADTATMASQAVVNCALLNSMLGLVLWSRYGEEYHPPRWVRNSIHLPGFIET